MVDFIGFPWIWHDFNGFGTFSALFHGFSWFSALFHGFYFFMVFHGFQHFFMVFSRKSRFFGVLKGFDTQNTDFPCFVCINPQKPGFPWFSDQNLESMMSTTIE